MAAFSHGAPPVRTIRAMLMYKDWVPSRMRFWLIMMFVFFYQFSGGVYLSTISQIQGELAFISEDVTMANYCSLIGLNIIFPMLFRWKFFFYTRQMWFVSSIGCLISAFIAYYVCNPWIFCLVSFLAGYFKMMGMFGCISTSQLNMTPTRNFGVFLPVIYLFVLGALRISDIAATFLAYFSNWKLIYCIVVLMMLIIDAIVYFMMKPDHRSVPFVPLKGIDWFGQLLWSATCISGAYIFNYGEHYGWWESQYIWIASWIFVMFLSLSLLRMFHSSHPYILPRAFTHPVTYFLCVLLFGVAFISAIAHYVQPIFINVVLGYDSINAIELNYPQLAGIIIGAILAYFAIVRLKWSIRQYLFVNVLLFMVYVGTMYFIVNPFVSKEMLVIPAFILSIAEIMMETGATYVLSQFIPFEVFFMNIAIIGFVRCGFGTAVAAGVVEHIFKVNIEQYESVEAIKECFGLGVWVCFAMLLLVLFSNYRHIGIKLVPKLFTEYLRVSHKLKSRT